MAAVRSLRFVLTGDDRSASKSLDRVGKKADGLGKKLGGLAAMGGAAAGAGVVAFAASSIKAFAEAEQAQAGLAQAYGKSAKTSDVALESLQKYNSELATKTKYDDDAIASGQTVLTQFNLTGKQIKDLTPLLLDYASMTGKDLPEAARDLGKASQGQFKALKNVGLQMKDLKDPTKNLAQLMDGLNKKVGGFAGAEGKTAAGQVKILKNRFGELQETVGEQLMPVVSSLVKWLNDEAVPALQGLAEGFKDGTGAGGDLRDIASGIGTALNDYVLPVFQWFGDHPDAAKFLGIAAAGGFLFVKAMKGVAALKGALLVLQGTAAATTTINATAPGAAVGVGALAKSTALFLGPIVGAMAAVLALTELLKWMDGHPDAVANLRAGNPTATIVLPGKPSPTVTFDGRTIPRGPIPAPKQKHFGLARGGPMYGGGTYLVGEEGPELVTPRRSGFVHTARKTQSLFNPGGSGFVPGKKVQGRMFNPTARLNHSRVRDVRDVDQSSGIAKMLTGRGDHWRQGQTGYTPKGMEQWYRQSATAARKPSSDVAYRPIVINIGGRTVAKRTTAETNKRAARGHPLPFGL